MKDNVGMEMAHANAVVTKKFLQKRMRRNPKSANKISHEYNEFAGIRGRKRFTCNGAPSGGYLILKDAFEHHSFQDLLGGHRFDPLLVAADLADTLCLLPP